MNKSMSTVYALFSIGALLSACSDDGETTTSSGAGGSNTGGAGTGSGAGGSNTGGAAAPELRFAAALDGTMGQFPEGIAVSADGNTAYVGLVLTGKVLALSLADGEVTDFGSVPAPPMNVGFVFGLALDSAGDVYVGVASFDSAAYQPGIYRIPKTGGAATLFASAPALIAPNGLVFTTSGDLLVTNSVPGSVFKISADGSSVTEWSSGPLLEGDVGPCAVDMRLPVGANGIAISDSNVFVANYNKATLVKIPILPDGSAGAPAELARADQSCSPIKGIDGIAADTDGSVLAVGNGSNTLVRIGTDGAIETLFTGDQLDGPASIVIATVGGQRSAFFTNSAIATAQAGGAARPGVLVYGPLP